MNHTTLKLLVVPAALVVAGCAGGGARQIDPGGREVITTIEDVDIQNYLQAARQLVGSMLRSGTLTRIDQQQPGPLIIELDRVENVTSERINVDLVTDLVRTEVLKSGQATFITPNAPLATADRQAARELDQDLPTADYTLSGSIANVGAQAGRTRQQTFVFTLTLSSRDGLTMWTDQVIITKQGRRNSVGLS